MKEGTYFTAPFSMLTHQLLNKSLHFSMESMLSVVVEKFVYLIYNVRNLWYTN